MKNKSKKRIKELLKQIEESLEIDGYYGLDWAFKEIREILELYEDDR